MAQYYVYGRILDSIVPLSLPVPAPEQFQSGLPGTCFVISDRDTSCDPGEVEWYHHHSFPDDSEPWLSLGKRDGYQVFQFRDGHCFLLHEDRDQIDLCLNGAESGSLEMESLLLNHVLPLTLAHRGATAIHASAIEFPQGAALFIGETGTGKSTLARHLAGANLRLLTDDCAVLDTGREPPLVFPGYPAIRVIDDSLDTVHRARGKAFLSPSESPFLFGPEPSHVAAVFQLEPKLSGAIEIEPLSQRDAQFALTRHAFRLDPGNRHRLQEEFKVNSNLAQRLPVFRLSYPHDANLLPEVCELLQRHLESLSDFASEKPSHFQNLDVQLA
jgi:energy-coupling factor transporter ATP-binding protein EcfA2